ncbi:hypothetical protein AMATHDRAFT_1030 [Amanita thiersii Skay4041]|uniref:K Homology domain-containing protein n=1 Tax=Amanita thiersii Skay4041 TaxID=703135 RepID=A0A2A9NWJ9_9AGAR|nr:hypothetical protein AMATHDRAFT_1030 [Amanita thiersii Skay4041]
MALSAADLQRRHALEGAPDPFPSLSDTPSSVVPSASKPPVELESEAAFPSLVASTPTAQPSQSAWGTGPRMGPSVKSALHTDTFTLSTIDLSSSGKDGKPVTLGEVMRQIMAKFKVKLDASGNQKSRQTTFHIKAESKKELDKAKRNLLAQLSPTVTIVIQAPASTIPSIIGPKGSTLKQIRDQTNVKVDIPKKEIAPNGNGHANGVNSGKATPLPNDAEDEPTVPITLSGPQPLVYEAQALLNEIIVSKTSIITLRVSNIPAHVLPFIRARRALFVTAAQGTEVHLGLNEAGREITVHGDREAVRRVIDKINQAVDGFTGLLTPVKITLPKRQHRLLVGKASEDIFVKSKCAITVPKFDEPSEEIAIWGQSTDLTAGLSAVMEQANSKYIHEFPVPGPIVNSKQLLTYMTKIQFPKTLAAENPGVSVYLPTQAAMDKGQNLSIDLVGEKPAVDATIRKISEMFGKLHGATKEVSIDWLLHRVIMGKNTKRIKQFHDMQNVLVYFPPETAEQSSVLLVYDPQSPSASPSPDEKNKHLEDVEKELLKMSKEAADVTHQTIDVEKRWHDAVVGVGGTTLNAIIGEDTTLSIKVGSEAGNPDTGDIILVRGITSEVDRAVKEILQIVENAKNDEIINSFETDFEIEREYVGRIVGAHGASVNKLREQLGVRVDVSDEVEEKESGKRKKATHQKSKIKITGRKENVEEAKKRILAQVERLADETSEVLKIPNQFHASLIGQNGKYAIRLEEKYSVKITFPRQGSENGEGKSREPLKLDEVLVKGGKKGVAGARSELLEAFEFEKESNNVLKFTVPTRSVARILGKNGTSINGIKDSTGAQIDIEKATDGAETTHVTVRGTKQAVNAAKAAILSIAEQVKEETTVTISIENKFHRAIIGAGGQGLKDLISRCGGPKDPKLQAGLVRFPRPGDQSDEVKLRGEPQIVANVQKELEKLVSSLRDRIVMGVSIRSSQHRALIGRGGQNLNEIQSRTGAQIQFPGSRSYQLVDEPENLAELANVDPADIVKVTGPLAACNAAIHELKSQVRTTSVEIIDTVTVPLKYFHLISQQGAFFRNLRTFGVHVESSAQPTKSSVPPKPISNAVPSARIDDPSEESAAPEAQWQVILNHQDTEEGDSIWTLKARDQAGLDRAKNMIRDAIQSAERMSHVGFLTLPDRSLFPRIVGAKGSNVTRLRNETGADITVSKEDSTIVIIGPEPSIHAAKDAILKMTTSNGGWSQRRA